MNAKKRGDIAKAVTGIALCTCVPSYFIAVVEPLLFIAIGAGDGSDNNDLAEKRNLYQRAIPSLHFLLIFTISFLELPVWAVVASSLIISGSGFGLLLVRLATRGELSADASDVLLWHAVLVGTGVMIATVRAHAHTRRDRHMFATTQKASRARDTSRHLLMDMSPFPRHAEQLLVDQEHGMRNRGAVIEATGEVTILHSWPCSYPRRTAWWCRTSSAAGDVFAATKRLSRPD